MATLTVPGCAQGLASPLLNVGGLRQATLTASPRKVFNSNAISTQKIKLRKCTGARATAEGMKENPPSVESSPDPEWMVRKREVLAMAAAAGVSMLLLPPGFAWADPVPIPGNFPNSRRCPSTDPFVRTQVRNTVNFTPPSYEVKVRRKAETLGGDSLLLYERAYELLRKKAVENPGDPRYYLLQAQAHCKYCRDQYRYNYPDADSEEFIVDIHGNYLFLPWHRLYLHFHERILHSLLKEDPEFADRADEFALPFWNYDNQVASDPVTRIPPIFDRRGSSLYEERRSPGTTLVNLNGVRGWSVETNMIAMRTAVLDQTTALSFFGDAIRATDCRPSVCINGPGLLENTVHNTVHGWVGGFMRALDTAAKDPIFFGGHHSNIDRLWTVWETLPTITGNPRKPPTDDPDWMEAAFLFFDENGDMVIAKVSDTLDTVNSLKYKYEDVPNPWLYVESAEARFLSSSDARLAPPRPNPSRSASSVDPSSPVELGESPIVIASVIRPPEKAQLPQARGGIMSRRGIRTFMEGPEDDAIEEDLPPPSLRNKKEEDVVELLIIEGVKFDMMESVRLNVFINLPDANQNTPITVPQYVGSYCSLPHGMDEDMNMQNREVNLKFSINRQLLALNVRKEDVSVIIVPVENSTKVTFKQVRIQ